jgi:hypothetical protein
VMPLDRSGSIDQPTFRAFHGKLDTGSWCHIFAEGKIRQVWWHGWMGYGVRGTASWAIDTRMLLIK